MALILAAVLCCWCCKLRVAGVVLNQGRNEFCFLCFHQAYVHKSVMEELKRIIDDSEITKEDDALWPPPDRVGRQVCEHFCVRIIF